MSRISSPKHAFMNSSDEQDFYDGLIRIERTQYKPHHVMLRLHKSLAETRLNVGGLGSGKTRAMCEHLYSMALTYPGSLVIVARRDLGDLKNTTQREFLEHVVSPETVDRFNVNENILYLKNRSQVLFMETKNPDNFKSYEIIAYGIDEADENEDPYLLRVLQFRLRQKIVINGENVPVPYAGIWTYNPTTDAHWLAQLEDKPDQHTEVFRSTTYDNEANLPDGYIPRLLSTLAPWEIRSLIYGERAMRPKGKPVIHGFTMESNVRPLQVFHHLPLYRSWDFGFNHPCVSFFQYDGDYKRFMKHRELLGDKEQLKLFAPKVVNETRALVGPTFPVIDVCDPHGADQKDVGESSVEYLRIHLGIYCNYKRQKIRTGLDEIQELVLSEADFKHRDWHDGEPIEKKSRFLVDPSCKHTVSAYMGGYYRGDDGLPVKDDFHDHPVDTDRYGVVHTMGAGLIAHRKKTHRRYVPRSAITGY